MAPVIHGLAQLPEADVRAMATYLMELPGQAPQAAQDPQPAPAAVPVAASVATQALATPAKALERHANGERIYQNACAVCHEAGSGPTLFGVKPLLAVNTNLHAASPDNLVQVILNGIQAPADDALGYMPGFRAAWTTGRSRTCSDICANDLHRRKKLGQTTRRRLNGCARRCRRMRTEGFNGRRHGRCRGYGPCALESLQDLGPDI
jgi:mono/diheme cytochrome c family protein